MQGMGFFFGISPWLKPKDGNYDKKALIRHLTYFNTHPFMASYILGVVARLEREGRYSEAVKAKEILMGPLGASGDGLFWASINPLTIVISLNVALFSPLAGILTLLLVSNAIQLSTRWKLFNRGWESAHDPLNYIGDRQDRQVAGQAHNIMPPFCGFLLGITAFRSGTPETAFLLFALSLLLFLKGWNTWRILFAVLAIAVVFGWFGVKMEMPWFVLR